MSQSQSLYEYADALIARLAAAGYRTGELPGEFAIINVYDQDSEGDEGYLYTLTLTRTPGC